MNARPRIAVIPERIGNVLSMHASIRLFSYFDLLRRAGHATVRFLLPSEVVRFAPDIIVWHRGSLADVNQVDAIQDLASRLGARTVYDLNDNLLVKQDVPRSEDRLHRARADAVHASLRCADDVWCATPQLALRIAQHRQGRVMVLPDALDPDIWGLDRPPRNSLSSNPSLRLLYMGSRTHHRDYAFLQAVMDRLHKVLPGSIELYLIGVTSRDEEGPPWLRVWQTPVNAGASYPAFVHWLIMRAGLDMGVAPLLESDFNDCKSSIKVLDYAAIGLPSLASDVPAYNHSLKAGVDCFREPNKVGAWVDKLSDLTVMQSERQDVYLNIRERLSIEAFRAAAMSRLSRMLAL